MISRNYETLVTKEDYLQFSRIDLDVELVSQAIDDVGDNPASCFIKGIEDIYINVYMHFLYPK